MALEVRPIFGAFNGLATKLAEIRANYRRAVLQHPQVRGWAEASAGRGGRRIQAERLFENLRRAVNFVGDPCGFRFQGRAVGLEYIKKPWEMISEIKSRGFSAGDCDDQAGLSYALLNSIGIPAGLRVVWRGGDMPSHVYALAYVDGSWLAYDTTGASMGQEIDGITRRLDFYT